MRIGEHWSCSLHARGLLLWPMGLLLCGVEYGFSEDPTDPGEPAVKARISFPYDRSLVRANVPVFGMAWAKEFDSWRLEFGVGSSPEEWILVRESRQPEPNDPWAEGRVVWNPDSGAHGNLADWETGLDEYAYGHVWRHQLHGVHTLRLTVKDRTGKTAHHAIEVTVARVITNWIGGYGLSPDRVVQFRVGPESIGSAFVLVSILPTKVLRPPPNLEPVSEIYEFQPPGLKLVRPAELSFRFSSRELPASREGIPAIPVSKLSIHAYDAEARQWVALPSRVRSSSALDPGAIRNWAGLCSRLVADTREGRPGPSARVRKQLSEGMQYRLEEGCRTGTWDPLLPAAILLAMNEVLQQPDLPEDEAFKNLTFGEPPKEHAEIETRERRNLEPQGRTNPDSFLKVEPKDDKKPGRGPTEEVPDLPTPEEPAGKVETGERKLFAAVEAKSLLERVATLGDLERERLNRLLLEAVYPGMILRSSADTVVIGADVVEIPRGLAFYGLFADLDPPKAPSLQDVPEQCPKRTLVVSGRAEPNSTVKVGLNGLETETQTARTGEWSCTVSLKEGENRLQAVCRDAAGNVGPATSERKIVYERRHPKRVNEVRLVGASEAVQGERFVVLVSGTDASPRVDTTVVRVFTTESDPKGIELDTVETRASSGEYVGVIEIADHTDPIAGKLLARIHREKVVAVWEGMKTSLRAEKAYADRVPPGLPEVRVEPASRLYWNSFEGGAREALQPWRPMDVNFGATPDLVTEKGNTFLRMSPSADRDGHAGISAWRTEYSVKQYPVLSFDFRCKSDVQVDCLVNLAQPAVGWKGVRLTDLEPYYTQIGSFGDVRGSLWWHHAEVNLLSFLESRYPGLGDYRVREIAFADWNGGSYLFGTKYFGYRAGGSGSYDVDNFAITSWSTEGRATFRWSVTDDSGIGGYSVVLDKRSKTVPPADAASQDTEKTYEGLEDGRWWFHVRAVDTRGSWGPTNHYLHVVDTKPPAVELLWNVDEPVPFGKEIQFRLSDAGSGVDPHHVVCHFAGRDYGVDGKALVWDSQRSVLALRPDRVEPYPIWFLDGEKVTAALRNVRDLAGHRMASDPSWTLRVASPLGLTGGADGKSETGWFTKEPEIRLKADSEKAWSLRWMRSLKGDRYASRGRAIRELAVVASGQETEGGGGAEFVTEWDGKQPVQFVVEVKTDSASPETRAELLESPPKKGVQNRPSIRLAHNAYAWRRGGLLGRYYRTADFKGEITARVDPFVYFFDDRGQFTPPVVGAHSAIWEGALYVPQTTEMDLELAIWTRAPASGRARIDGDLIFDLRPEKMAQLGLQRKKVLLTEGMHELHLEFQEPTERAWSFALFRYQNDARGGGEKRDAFGPGEFYYAENLGTTYCRWNEQPFEVYRDPLAVLSGKNTLQFYTQDHLGRTEAVQAREFEFKEAIAEQGQRPGVKEPAPDLPIRPKE